MNQYEMQPGYQPVYQFQQPMYQVQQPLYQDQIQYPNQPQGQFPGYPVQDIQIDYSQYPNPSLVASAPTMEYGDPTYYYQTPQPPFQAQQYAPQAPVGTPQPKFETHPNLIWKVVSIPFKVVAGLGLSALTVGLGSATSVVATTTFFLLVSGNPSFVLFGAGTLAFGGATAGCAFFASRFFMGAINDVLSILP